MAMAAAASPSRRSPAVKDGETAGSQHIAQALDHRFGLAFFVLANLPGQVLYIRYLGANAAGEGIQLL